jgi:exosome complex protein LRP1
MLERQQYEKELKEQDEAESEEEELAVFGDDDIGMDIDSSVLTSASKGKGKGKEVQKAIHEPIPQPSSKRRRPVVDPFAGKALITWFNIGH